MRHPVDGLLELFELENLGEDRFRVRNADKGFGPRVFGGQVASQALYAATRTVAPEQAPHSLHAYFIRPGRPKVPIDYEVERTRDGRSFTTRRVVARQPADPPTGGPEEVIFEMSCSFHGAEDGVDYQLPRATGITEPDETPAEMPFIPESERERVPFEFRNVSRPGPDEAGWYPSTHRVWMRIRRRLPDDPLLHACILTYLSDMGAVLASMAPVPEYREDRLMAASLDHALWFHRPLRADEWILYDLHSVSNFGARGMCRGTMHTPEGVLGASMAQETLLRVLDAPAPSP